MLLMHQTNYGSTTEIHKRPRLGQQQLLISYSSDAYSGPALSVVKSNRMEPGKVIQAPEANIMAIVRINSAGIA
jgi:hypothetical protein